jgi:hypothetical protein
LLRPVERAAEEPLLQADPYKFGLGATARRLGTKAATTQITVCRKLCGHRQLGGILGQPDLYLLYL